MQPGPELRLGDPPAPEPHGQAVPTLVGDRLLERPNDGWTEMGQREVGGAVSPLFNSCLLLKAEREFLKPTIRVSPSRVVAFGGNITIRCEGWKRSMKFFLRKPGHPNPQVQTVPEGKVAEFPIAKVSREDGGSYTCDYRSITEPSRSSYPSDPVEIIVGEPSYPKPNISLSPSGPSGGVSLGTAVSVWCRGQRPGMRFVLNKEGRHFPPVDSDGLEVVFPISNVRREDGGSYSCSYHSKSEPFNVSYPSDPVELVVRGGTDSAQPGAAPAPTLPGSAGPGESKPLALTWPITAGVSTAAAILLFVLVAFVCFRKTRARKGTAPRLSSTSPLGVLKAPDQQDSIYSSIDDEKELQTLEPDPGTDGLTYAELDNQVLQAKRGGQPPASEPAQSSMYAAINVNWGAPRMDPARLSAAVNAERLARLYVLSSQSEQEPELPELLCAVERNNTSFLLAFREQLHTVERRFTTRPVWDDDPRLQNGQMREAPSLGLRAELAPALWRKDTQMRDASRGEAPGDRSVDAGDSRLLPVSRESAGKLPAPGPSISVSPSRVIAPGGAVTIRCQCRCEARRLFLYKDGIEIQELDAAGDGGEFIIPSARREDGGVYMCRSRSRSEPPNWSDPSDIVRIISSSTPNPPSPCAPAGGVSLGGAVTVRCWGRHQSMRFLLYKDGNPTALQDVEPAGDLAEILIHNVSRRDAGSYRCYYHDKRYQFTWSYPSDPVELVVAAAPPGHPDFTYANIARLVLSTMVLFVLGLILSDAYYSHLRGAPRSLDPAVQRRAASPWGAEMPAQIPCPQTPLPQRIPPPRVFPTQLLHPRIEPRPLAPQAPGAAVTPEPPNVPSWGVQPTKIPSGNRNVHEPSYPKPTISGIPREGVSLGGSVSIWCKGQNQFMQFVLYKDGRHLQSVDANSQTLFLINIVSREQGGNYSCSYLSKSEPFTMSDPSDPVELVVRDPGLPRPNISLSPTGVMAPGADVTIRVGREHEGSYSCSFRPRSEPFVSSPPSDLVQLVAGDLNPQQHMDTAGNVSEFRILIVGRQHGGNYSCSYRLRSEPFISSLPSDPVQLVVAEPSYPKPSISGIPSEGVSLGGSVSIWCKGQHQVVQFVLNKDGRHVQSVDANSQTLFLINIVSREDGGNYSCSYRSRLEPFKMSDPSDPVELVVRDPSLPRPSISLSPTGVTAPGADVTIRAGDQNLQRHMDPAGDGAEFRIPSVGRQHGGSYSCSYRRPSEPFVSSQPSDPVQLVVADPTLPRPSISLSPTGVTAPGGDVTIRCEGQRRDVRFFLHKAGDLNPQQQMDTAGNVSEFRILSVGHQHGGSYSCSYRPRSEPFISSLPGDPVQLVVAEPSYPKPSISGIPSEGVSLGGSVSIWCKGQHQVVQFVLNKDGRHVQSVDANSQTLFLINIVSREDGGNYSCSYRSRLEPFKMSDPSDPVELVVRGGSEPNAAPGLTRPIIAGVSAAASGLLLLLLLVAFICYRRTRGNSNIDHGKEMQTLEPDSGTYAELDGQTLQPRVYDMINMSQGVPQ
ncbi:uncharacterized protein LOC120388473 [Mauremys reevesii]|uniref:uncharacterized protein LOC120388473 n=1 Tax=Mauremys reevesii TaxID=260615 RepID=UPI00193F87FC|nr:uncharacterized protein LOC120388473 [Mauremys reevesii]